ncbi:hypothetical protein H5410_049113 [Solanum commersonii]|uniref:Cytochrome P450 n=1 Tax=Solanum commersonii TaxID=4109 RepID=A0A9J5XMI2_SOLCO|nr:hypothetical protein H5410_049113 [Solanum commersonii]
MEKQVLKNHDLAFSTRFVPDALQAHNYCKFSAVWLPVQLTDAILSIVDVAGKINLVDFFPILEKIDPQRMSAENPEEMDQNYVNSMLLDLFIGGIDTITSTLEWAMAKILRQPEIMKKVQVELAQVVGKGKPIEEADTSSTSSILNPRRVDQDVELCDYIIPKGSLVLDNAWAIGRDSSFWEDALVFKPERFQSLELNMRGKDFELIPFGAGRRTCPGFPLALRLMPAILGSMLNSFNWKLEACIEPKDLDMEEKFGVILRKAHHLRAIPSPL